MNEDHIAIVTGSARGIGLEITRVLSEQGVKVCAIDLDFQELNSATRQLNKGDLVTAFQCDVSDSKMIHNTLDQILTMGSPALLVNNAGFGGPFETLDQISDDNWQKVLHTNVSSAFYFSRKLLPIMREMQFGRIINISSIQGLFGAKFSSAYVASKHALIGLSKSIAAEWGEHNITCNTICPGYIETQMGAQDDKIDDHRQKIMNITPMKKMGTTGDIANLVVYLSGPHGQYINGSQFVVDGGISCHVAI